MTRDDANTKDSMIQPDVPPVACVATAPATHPTLDLAAINTEFENSVKMVRQATAKYDAAAGISQDVLGFKIRV